MKNKTQAGATWCVL